ncbi:unnamed protein product [Ambrosiozyma monospora]|uniref:Unnamed protein product n=1 Tax=Ambrosiozyma monospora TaxID=43982 RepID=A0A9W7DBB2_AMBMO|nr:unnamed protein product [Ambrosiozyma monospora]
MSYSDGFGDFDFGFIDEMYKEEMRNRWKKPKKKNGKIGTFKYPDHTEFETPGETLSHNPLIIDTDKYNRIESVGATQPSDWKPDAKPEYEQPKIPSSPPYDDNEAVLIEAKPEKVIEYITFDEYYKNKKEYKNNNRKVIRDVCLKLKSGRILPPTDMSRNEFQMSFSVSQAGNRKSKFFNVSVLDSKLKYDYNVRFQGTRPIYFNMSNNSDYLEKVNHILSKVMFNLDVRLRVWKGARYFNIAGLYPLATVKYADHAIDPSPEPFYVTFPPSTAVDYITAQSQERAEKAKKKTSASPGKKRASPVKRKSLTADVNDVSGSPKKKKTVIKAKSTNVASKSPISRIRTRSRTSKLAESTD